MSNKCLKENKIQVREREGESERERKQEIKPANDQSTIANLPILYATFDGIIVSYNDDPAIEPQAGFLISG